MAVTIPGDENKAEAAVSAQPTSKSNEKPVGFTSANGTIYESGFTRARSQDSVTKLQAAVRKVIDAHLEAGAAAAKNCDVFTLDRSLGLNVAAVVFSYKETYQGKHVACVYPMLIERTADPLPPRTLNEDGTTFNVVRTISEYFDKDLWSIMVAQAKRILGSQYDIVDGTGLVIPVETPSDGDEYTALVQSLVWNASNACRTRVHESLGVPMLPFSVTGSANAKERVDATVYLNPGHARSLTGQPIRQDISIQMSASSNDNRNTLHGSNSRVVTVGGYLDLVYKPQQPNQSQQYMYPGQPVPVQTFYRPRFVITNNISEMKGESLEHHLLGIYLSTLVSLDGLWKRMLLPAPVSGFDANDFGAIGYEVNVTNDPKMKPAKIDLKADEVGVDDFYALVNRVCDQDPIFSIHLSEFDDRTWLHDAFIMLINGGASEQAAARKTIIGACNSLTNGHFASHFGPEDQIIYGENNRIHQAYYIDANGEFVDGRCLDSYLPILNYHGAKEPDTVRDWAFTHELQAVSLEHRRSDRHRILKGTISSYSVTGNYQLGTFFPAFLSALSKAIREAGLYIQPNNITHDTGSRVRGNSALDGMGFSIHHDAHGFRSTQNAHDPSSFQNGGYSGRFR